MKIYLTETDSTLFTAVALRHVMAKAGLPAICPIRKCRRDRRCSGPLLTGTEMHSLRLSDGEALLPEEGQVPICMCLCRHRESTIMCARALSLIRACVRQKPERPLLDNGRAIGARQWRKIGDFSR